MALSNILPAFAQRLQLVAKASPAAARAWMSSNASKAGQEEVYVYQSPGSSIHDPALTGHSLSNPVYVYDPKPPAGPAARSGVTTQPIQAASKATPSTVRPTAAYAAQQVQQQQRADAEATYVYTPPGSSMSSPSYGVSVKDPVYVVDPAPSATTAAAKHSSNTQQQQQQKVASAPPANRKRVGLPTDDLASVPYVASTRGSMHEPRYVSVSDPQDRK